MKWIRFFLPPNTILREKEKEGDLVLTMSKKARTTHTYVWWPSPGADRENKSFLPSCLFYRCERKLVRICHKIHIQAIIRDSGTEQSCFCTRPLSEESVISVFVSRATLLICQTQATPPARPFFSTRAGSVCRQIR